MIKNSIFFLFFLGTFVFSSFKPSANIDGIWVVKSVNGEENPRLNGSYIEFLDNGWFVMGSINRESYDKGKWVCAPDKKVMFFYTEPSSNDKVLRETEIVKIQVLTKDTLIIQMKKKVFEFVNLRLESPEVQEAFKLKKVVLSDDIVEAVKKRAEVEPKKENNESLDDATNEMLDSNPHKNNNSKEPKMEIVAKASALIGKWNIVGMNMNFVIMQGEIEDNKNDIGYMDFKKDGSLRMKLNGKEISTDNTQWVVVEDINTIFQYVLSEKADVGSKVEFFKIYELYNNKMTLWVKPLRGYIYLEKMDKE
ncbi:hypothetical protein N1F78_12070 [Seonamhaeicola sp. MEBiC1930]|uniref:hypothetical protein n=1 Tax=Seonamhaeicola sp. MEBiC01930 TaxID=2976768 RepID=UPI003253E873